MKSTQFFKHSAFILLGLGLVSSPAHATVMVGATADANTLANIISGSGVTISGAKYNGAPLASGTFTGGSSAGIGIDTGIILTTGNAKDAEGPNNADGTTIDNPTGGDPELSALINGATTNDAASLTLDFTTTGGDLFFNYVFASEEYNEYVNSSYNDVFGFFLDGNNIALIPGTTTPVSINNVNGGKPFGANAKNPQFYNNNDPNDPGPPSFNIEYDGFTKVFQAQALNLKPGTHTIKLAIADAGDSGLDSAVFIQGGSFSDVPATPIPFEFSPSFGLLVLGIWGGIGQLKSLVQKSKSSESAFSKN